MIEWLKVFYEYLRINCAHFSLNSVHKKLVIKTNSFVCINTN